MRPPATPTIVGIVAGAALTSLCTVLPFLPGRYDPLAVPLALMAQIAGTAGLVLMPIGALWFIAERKRNTIAALAVVATSLVWTIVALAAAVQGGFVLSFITVALGVFYLRKAWRTRESHTLPLILIVVPATAGLLQFAAVDRAITFSRSRAIHNGAPLIAAIERYKTMNGHYPASLLSVHQDYSPGITGIQSYHYEPHKASFNLFFEQFSNRFGTREFVVYNPLNEQVMTSHALDLLELTPDQIELERTRGHYAVHDAGHANWKYFWFD